MSENQGAPRRDYGGVADRLRSVDAELEAADQAVGTSLEVELLELHDELEALGLVRLLLPSESAPIAPDNLSNTLNDRSGIAAVRASLRTMARLADSRARLGPHGWEGSDWDVLVVRRDGHAPSDAFARELCFELGNQWNLAAFYAPERVTPMEEASYPPAGVTASNDPAFREWALSWNGPMLWWEELPNGLRIRLEKGRVRGEPEMFDYSETPTAATRAAELIAQHIPDLDEADQEARASTITVQEHRALEATLRVVVEHRETVRLSAEDESQLDVLIEMLQLQLRAPRPDRPIIGRILRGMATIGGGVLVGVAGNYLTDLVRSFGFAWP